MRVELINLMHWGLVNNMAKEFTCIVCTATNEPAIVSRKIKGDLNLGLEAVQCPSCGHLQLSPHSYSIEHYHQDGQTKFVLHDYGTPIEKIVKHSWIEASRRVKRFADYGIDLITPGKQLRVLDIGGGYGFFASELKQQYPNIDVKVMEPSLKRTELGRAYIAADEKGRPIPNFIVDPLDEDFVARYRGTFDIVTMWHVLEHVANPVEFLKLACQLVAIETGVVCVEVPNADDELIRLSAGYRDRNYMIEHISYFHRHTLEAVARRAIPESRVVIRGYQRYGIFNYFHWLHFNKPQGENPDMFEGVDRWWLEATWRTVREEAMTSDALVMCINVL